MVCCDVRRGGPTGLRETTELTGARGQGGGRLSEEVTGSSRGGGLGARRAAGPSFALFGRAGTAACFTG